MNTNLEDSVVLITSSSSNSTKKDAIGTGFVIYREAETTYLLTCAHVVEAVGGKDNVQIYGQPATVIASSDVKDFDLAVVQVKNLPKINDPLKLQLQNSGQKETSVKMGACHCHFFERKSMYACQWLDGATASQWFRFFFAKGDTLRVNIPGHYLYSSEKKRCFRTIQGSLNKSQSIDRKNQQTGNNAIAWNIEIKVPDKLEQGYSGSPVIDKDSGVVIGVVTNMEKDKQKGQIISIEALEFLEPTDPTDSSFLSLINKLKQPPINCIKYKLILIGFLVIVIIPVSVVVSSIQNKVSLTVKRINTYQIEVSWKNLPQESRLYLMTSDDKRYYDPQLIPRSGKSNLAKNEGIKKVVIARIKSDANFSDSGITADQLEEVIAEELISTQN